MGSVPRLIGSSIVGVAIAVYAAAQPDTITIGAVDFYGTVGVDVGAVRAAVPVRAGDTITPDTVEGLKRRIEDAVARTAGAPATDVTLVCCDARGASLIYIGLPGRNVRAAPHRTAPQGRTCLAADAMQLSVRAADALQKAIHSGDAAEDLSNGYALSHDPEYRAAQLAMREYARTHAPGIRAALAGCVDAEHRAAAAQLLGYANRSRGQIDALVRASRDPDRTVRNNAVRALWALASARTAKAAASIPAGPFIPLLNSATWEDRNKAGSLLSVLVTAADRSVLDRLRRDALESLIEMARWQDHGHADVHRLLLGRVAGLQEPRLGELVSSGDVESIVAAARHR